MEKKTKLDSIPLMPYKSGVLGKRNVIIIPNVSERQMIYLLEQLCGNKGGIPPQQQWPQ